MDKLNKTRKSGIKRLSKTERVLRDIKRKDDTEKKSIWREKYLNPKKDFDKISKILDARDTFKVKIFRTNNKGYGPGCSMPEPLKYEGKQGAFGLQNYLGYKMDGYDKVKKVEKFTYGMIFKTNDYDIFINNPYLEEKIAEYKIVETINSTLYNSDKSFIDEFKENNNKSDLNGNEIEKLEEEKDEYYNGEFWLGMKTSLEIGNTEYKIHQDHNNKEFIIEYGFNKDYKKFRYPNQFDEKEEYEIKQELLFKTI